MRATWNWSSCHRRMPYATQPGRRRQRPPAGHDGPGGAARCRRPPVGFGYGAERDAGTRPMSSHTSNELEQPEAARGAGADDPLRRALQYRWLSTDQRLGDLELGLVEACGSRHDVDLVLVRTEQGYWAGDLDSYGRAPSWLRRLRRGEDRRRQASGP